jgi:hypothetical protein
MTVGFMFGAEGIASNNERAIMFLYEVLINTTSGKEVFLTEAPTAREARKIARNELVDEMPYTIISIARH